MFRSISTTWGWVAATVSTAAAPSSAWPTTVIPGSVPSSRTRPSRTAAWSSATTTVTGSGFSVMPESSGLTCQFPASGPRFEGTARQRGPFGQADQAEAGRRCRPAVVRACRGGIGLTTLSVIWSGS